MKLETLKPYLGRGVYQVEDTKRGMTMKEIIATRRPWWSKVGGKLFAIPGGGIKPVDFVPLVEAGTMTQEQFDDPEFIPSEDLLILAAENTVKREFLEELGPEAAAAVAVGLIYIGKAETYDETNDITWVSYIYGKNGDKKVALLVKPESDGTVWENSPDVLNKETGLHYLSDHFDMAGVAIMKLDEQT